MRDARRAERHWLVIAVATLWLVSVGGHVDANLSVSGWENLPMRHVARKQAKQRKRPRRLSCFTRGVIAITVALLQGHALPVGFFAPFEWPGGSQARLLSIQLDFYTS
jgi:hypothetical protein